MMEEQEKVEKARKPKVKKGRGRNARKKTKKVNSNSTGEADGDGYEVRVVELVALSTGVYWASANEVVYLLGLMVCLLAWNFSKSSPHHLSNDDCLEVKREDYQNYSVLCCVRQLRTMIRRHT